MRITDTGLAFPPIPGRWGDEERHFALGLRSLFEQYHWRRAYPVGIVVLSGRTDENDRPLKPFTFGEWEEIQTGITGVHGWRRVK